MKSKFKDLIKKEIELNNLNFTDKEDLINYIEFISFKYSGADFLEKKIYTEIKKEIKKMVKQNEEVIYDKPEQYDLSWYDFCYKSLTPEEYGILCLFFKTRFSINRIAEIAEMDRKKVKLIIQESCKKMFNDNQYLIED